MPQNTGCLTLNNVNVASDELIEVNAESITFGVGNTGTATNGQARITNIEIVYEKVDGEDTDIPVEPEDPEIIKGDSNGDGVVSSKDNTLLRRYLAGWDIEGLNLEASDINGDGEVNSKDVTYLARALAGWDGFEI